MAYAICRHLIRACQIYNKSLPSYRPPQNFVLTARRGAKARTNAEIVVEKENIEKEIAATISASATSSTTATSTTSRKRKLEDESDKSSNSKRGKIVSNDEIVPAKRKPGRPRKKEIICSAALNLD